MRRRTGILFALVVILIGATAALLFWRWDAIVARVSKKAVLAERSAWVKKTQELQNTINQMRREEKVRGQLSVERLKQVFGPESPLLRGVSPQNMRCQELEQSLRAYCRYLESSETRRAHELNQDVWTFFSGILNNLGQHPPAISGESYRPNVIIENSFYFSRLLGRKKINFIRDVLSSDADLAEPLMGILYHWLLTGQQCQTPGPSTDALKTMYSYAGFFLNTLGGHSYLYRRDSKARLLTVYYATQVIHEANLRSLNEIGVDLRFFLPLLFNEIQNRNDLIYAEEYLKVLSNLQVHYFQS
jgi:hypothetical protein